MKHLLRNQCSLGFYAAIAACMFTSLTHSEDKTQTPQETEVTVTLTVPAKFERESENAWLRLQGATPAQNFRFHWSYLSKDGKTVATIPCEIQQNQTCIFTIEGVRHSGSDTLINAKIMQITSDEGKTLYDRTICEVHHCKMNKKDVPIIWGLPVLNPEDPSPQQTKELFPNRFEVSFGGCIPMPGKKTEKILQCPQCLEAFAKWKAAK